MTKLLMCNKNVLYYSKMLSQKQQMQTTLKNKNRLVNKTINMFKQMAMTRFFTACKIMNIF